MGSWWRDRHRPKPSVAGSGEIPLPGMTSWLCAGQRYTLAPSPIGGELGEPSREDEPAGAPVLQRGGLELKPTAWQRAVASGEVGCGNYLPCPASRQRLGPDARDVLFTPPAVGLTGAGSRDPGGCHIWWVFGHCVLGCRRGGLRGRS